MKSFVDWELGFAAPTSHRQMLDFQSDGAGGEFCLQ
jgi:hypothetical protein